jgi:secreted trypsin-like serine protease
VNALAGENVKSANENEFKFVVSILTIDNSLQLPIERFHRCTGTLVSKQDILTAEHCMQDILPSSVKVLVGSIDLALSTEFRPMFFLPFENWSQQNEIWMEHQNNDIAFIKVIIFRNNFLRIYTNLTNCGHCTLYLFHSNICG